MALSDQGNHRPRILHSVYYLKRHGEQHISVYHTLTAVLLVLLAGSAGSAGCSSWSGLRRQQKSLFFLVARTAITNRTTDHGEQRYHVFFGFTERQLNINNRPWLTSLPYVINRSQNKKHTVWQEQILVVVGSMQIITNNGM